MDKLLIRGGRELRGEVLISGAKNAALPELCAALLTDQPVVLHNVPRLQDVSTMLKLVRNMGVAAERDDNGTVRLDAGDLSIPEGCSLFAVIRDGIATPMRSDMVLQEGDKVIAIGRADCERLLHEQLIGTEDEVPAG